MERTSSITITEEELKRERRQAAQEAIDAVMHRFDSMERRLQALHGFADKATLASIYETTLRTIERWDKRHSFRRVDGPRRDRVYYDLEDVARKVCKASENALGEAQAEGAQSEDAQSESEREASSGPED